MPVFLLFSPANRANDGTNARRCARYQSVILHIPMRENALFTPGCPPERKD